MGSDAHKMGFANSGNLHNFSDAADVRQGGTDKIDVVILHQSVEVPPVAPLLAGRQRDVDLAAQDRKVLQEGFSPNRVFDEERGQVLDLVTAPDGIGQVKALVEIDNPIAVFADAFPRLGTLVAKMGNSLSGVVSSIGGEVPPARSESAITNPPGGVGAFLYAPAPRGAP